MISMKELNPRGHKLSERDQSNLVELHRRMNVFRKAYGRPMFVTSPYRTIDEHRTVYKRIERRKGLKNIRIPMGSKHLTGQAVDILDASGELKAWIKKNEPLLEEIGLWCEDFSATPTWVHFQTVAPRSGKRFFKP